MLEYLKIGKKLTTNQAVARSNRARRAIHKKPGLCAGFFYGRVFGRGGVHVRQTLLQAEFGRQSAAAAPRRGLNAGGNRVEIYRARRADKNSQLLKNKVRKKTSSLI